MTTPDNPFRPPAGKGDKFDTHAYKGCLLLVYCKGYQDLVKTSKGESSAADCDIIVIDRMDPVTNMPEFFDGAKLFGNLARSVGRDDGVGAYTLGWLDQVPTSAGNEAWVLRDATQDGAATQAASPWWQAHQQKRFKASVKPAQQQAAQGYQGPPQGQAQWQQDAWGGMNAAPAQPPAQAQGWGAMPPAQPAPQYGAPGPAAAPVADADPNIAFLIGKGLNPEQVQGMDPATRAAVAATLQ